MKNMIFISSLIVLMGCHSMGKKGDVAVSKAPLPTSLEAAVNSEDRNADNRARDKYRHPLQTLQFFDIQPQQTVVEIWPAGGWYTEILAPYLATSGHYIAATSQAGAKAHPEMDQQFTNWMKAHPAAAAKMTVVDFQPPTNTELAPAGTVDRIVTFRNFHNWMMSKGEKAAMKAFFKALKPGGILGIVEHRGNPHKKQSAQTNSGYVREDLVIKEAKAAGFRLMEKSEVNANPKDTKDYAEGVWTLPPFLRLGDKDRAKYLAIGESDRMTLKFVKP